MVEFVVVGVLDVDVVVVAVGVPLLTVVVWFCGWALLVPLWLLLLLLLLVGAAFEVADDDDDVDEDADTTAAEAASIMLCSDWI